MNPAIWIAIFLPLFVILYQQRQSQKAVLVRQIQKNWKRSNSGMHEIVTSFIGKDCLIYTMNNQVTGIVREVTDGWVRLENGQGTEAVNLDYIVRIREYPKNKNGKRKSIVTD